MTTLVLATGNAGKTRELAHLLRGLPLDLLDLRDLPGLGEAEEDGATLSENALKKARHCVRGSGYWALADDTGLEVEALGGAPGVRSARWGGEPADPVRNNRKLLEELRGVPASRRAARFRCVLALAAPDGREWTAQGEVSGTILEAPRGGEGFGYDPLFLLPDLGRTMAELSFEEKSLWSHRARAAQALRPALSALLGGEGALRPCPRCGLDLEGRPCRPGCPGCGYQEDCSDVAPD